MVIDGDKEIKSFDGLFKYCRNIENINFVKINNNNIIDMSNMFSQCSNLISLPDLSKCVINKVKNINSIFLIVNLYYQYLIYLNGILIMLLI